MRLYLDAAPIVYWVEQVPGLAPAVDLARRRPGIELVSSHLALMECLVRPRRDGNLALEQEFDAFFAQVVGVAAPFTEAVFRAATEIRARHRYRTPDALHLAAALHSRCDTFLTNDAALAGPSIVVEIVSNGAGP